MDAEVLFSNNFVKLSRIGEDFYIETFRSGMAINDIMAAHPEIKITSFNTIKNALIKAPCPPVKFGELRESVFIEISPDALEAYVSLYVNENALTGESRIALIKDILFKLNSNGIVYGIKKDVLYSSLAVNQRILVAEGTPPVNGEDAVIRMYEMKEPKPEIKDDGKVNHYELNLINRVNEGDWLGERIEATEGLPGKNVKGEVISPIRGKRLPLFYDPNTVKEVHENGKTRLLSRIKGAVHYNGDRIGVSNFLEITGDVDYNTGNIDFDGFLSVKGSIADNFSINAVRDIEILGEFGVGSVKEVYSKDGSIYIRGGIAGKNKATITCDRDLYTKFVSDATIVCNGTVHVGFYCMNSDITAKQLIIDSPKGQIMGGSVKVEYKVEAAYIGNVGEKRTVISVAGFDKGQLKENYDNMLALLEKERNLLAKVKQEMSVFSYSSDLDARSLKEQEKVTQQYFDVKDNIKLIEYQVRTIAQYLKVKGEGEISVMKRIYPNTSIQIKKGIMEIKKETVSPCFYYHEGQLNVM